MKPYPEGSHLDALVKCLHRVGQHVCLSKHFPGVCQRGGPCIGKGEAVMLSIEEGHAEFLFKVANLPGNRRLGNIEPRGGSADVGLLGSHDKVSQVS